MFHTIFVHFPRTTRGFAGVLIALLFLGAMLWAKGRDPFQRIWFKIKVPGQAEAECIAVLPKMATWPLPVVVYLHGSGGSLLGDGNEVRQGGFSVFETPTLEEVIEMQK